MGWISSARHLVAPPGVESGQEGWLSFGQPGIPTAPPLLAEHFVKPEPGVLVLFPSYMWRAAAPFQGGARLTAAFDVLPAWGGHVERGWSVQFLIFEFISSRAFFCLNGRRVCCSALERPMSCNPIGSPRRVDALTK